MVTTWEVTSGSGGFERFDRTDGAYIAQLWHGRLPFWKAYGPDGRALTRPNGHDAAFTNHSPAMDYLNDACPVAGA